MMVSAVSKRDQMEGRQAGRQARQRAFMSTLCVEDVTARLMSEHVPVSIFYECKKKKKKKIYSKSLGCTVFPLRIMNLFQNHTSKEVKLKD